MQAIVQLTVTSVISIVFFSAFFSLFLAIILRSTKILSRIRYEILFLCISMPLLKMLIPMEIIPWTKNINVSYVLPQIVTYTNRTSFVIGEQSYPLWEIILHVFLVIAIIKIAILLISYVRFAVRVKYLPQADQDTQKMVEEILEKEGKKASVSVKKTSLFSEPTVFGVFKPVILIPNLELNDKELECVLRHEIAHCLYGDSVIQFIWLLIKAICWWNPVVYFLDKQLVTLLEIRADENALRRQDEIFINEFLQTLVVVDVLVSGKKRNPTFCVAFGGNSLGTKKRIELVIERNNRNARSIFISTFITSFCIVAIAVVMNCFIFEPLRILPEEGIEGHQMVTKDNSFLIKNEQGTFDMYYHGRYCVTLDSNNGTNMVIYESLDEALKYEEIDLNYINE